MDVDDTRAAQRAGHGARTALAWLAILALAALVAWLASERNARQWYLVPEDGRLVVKRGVYFPVGRQDLGSAEPGAAAYAPVVPPVGAKLPGERSFDDRSGLDQALYEALAGWAKQDVESGEPQRLERALGYLSRAERLAGISPAQRDDLAALRAESAWYEGQRLVARAAEDLRQAAEKLRTAASGRATHAAEAQALLQKLEPAVDAALAAAKAAPKPPSAPAKGDALAPAEAPAAGASEK